MSIEDIDLSGLRGTAWQSCMLCSWSGPLSEIHDCPRKPEKLEETIRAAEEQLRDGWPEEAHRTLLRSISAIDSLSDNNRTPGEEK